jgi:hypothetical protein
LNIQRIPFEIMPGAAEQFEVVFQLIERSKGWTARSRAEQLGQELLAAESPEQLAVIARELGTLDDAAAKPLVQALVSDDPSISLAAGNEVSRLLAVRPQCSPRHD